MPIYEYTCPNCDHHFEKLFLGNPGEVSCPSCGGAEVRRLFSSFSVGGSSPTEEVPACGRCGSTVPGQCNLN